VVDVVVSGSSPHSELRDFLRRLSEWDMLNLDPGSGSDGPYWQGEIRVAQDALSRLEEQLEALQDAVDDAILVFEDTKWWEAYHHLLSPLPSHPATYRDGDAIKGRSGWFWSEAEGRPVWNPASESLS